MNKKTYVISGIIIVGILSLYFKGGSNSLNVQMYPVPTGLPPEVATELPELLSRLEKLIEKKRPQSVQYLQEGLTGQELDDLQMKYKILLPYELREFYKWHNGSRRFSNNKYMPDNQFIPGKDFVPLEDALKNNLEIKKYKDKHQYSFLPDLTFNNSWIQIFDDGAGDGYYFDPQRSGDQGYVFDSFLETGYFRFYPSLKNLLMEFIECYEKDIFYMTTMDGMPYYDMHYEKAEIVKNKYSVEREY